MTLKECTSCYESKSIDDFAWKKKNKSKQSTCKSCTRARSKRHYHANKEKYRDAARKFNIKVRQFIWDFYSTHPCVECGEEDPTVLQFDHICDKEIGISEAVHNNWGIKRLQKEIEKCVVRCANCHARKTARQSNWYVGLDTSKERKIENMDEAVIKALQAVTIGENGASTVGPDFTMQRVIGIAVDAKELREVKELSEDEQHELQMELVKKFHIRVGRLFQ